MEIRYFSEEKIIIVKLDKDIDHHQTTNIRSKVDEEIRRYMPNKLVFDFANIDFMDSAGIGLLLGRYNLMSMLGGNVEISNMSYQIKRVLEMSGVSRVIKECNSDELKKLEQEV